jgi:D-arabinose 1-dehydrogenase-like Zn-dependent alcohol dehydrogenase
VDNKREGLELAGELPLSPDLIVDFNDPEATEKVLAFTDRLGLEAVVVCTDDVAANEWSLNIIQPAGTCVVLGLPEGGFHFDAFALVFKEISVEGSLLTDSFSAHQMMEVVDKHNIRSHISVLPLEDAQSIPDRYMRSDLKGRLVVTL